MHTGTYSLSRRLSALIPILFALLLTISCGREAGPSADSTPQDRQVLRRGLGGQPGSFDPQRAGDTFAFDVLRDLYEGLTSSSPGGEIVPAVAESWSIDGSGVVYTFELRADARWSNGDPVTAQDFVIGLRRAVDPQTAAAGGELLQAIEHAPAIIRGELPPDRLAVRALGERRLEVTLSRPLPYFPDILTNTIAFPVHSSSLAPNGGFALPGGTVSNGPYVLAGVQPGSSIRLGRNVRYWDSAGVAYDEVRYEIVPDEMAEYTRFRAGGLDATNNVPEQHFQELAGRADSGLQFRSSLATFYYSFNDASGPLSGKPGLREALSLAIDRQDIARLVARAGQVPAYSLVPEGIWNYSPPALASAALEPQARRARARELYAAAGYSQGRPLQLRMLYNENDLIQKVSLAIAASWKGLLGVETEMRQLEFRAYLGARGKPSGWDVVRVGWSADYNDASTFLDTLRPGSPQNFGRWNDPAYARLLDAAAAEPDSGRRRALLEQAEAWMLQQHPVMPVYFYVTRRLVRAGVAAPPLDPLHRNYSKYFRPQQ